MDTPKQDRRSRKTREAILSAFSDLILRHGYAGTTVDGIAEHADIGRSTFYEHFTGKDDVLAESLTGPFSTLAETVHPTRPLAAFVTLLDHFRAQRRWCQALFLGPARKLMTRRLAALIEPRLAERGGEAAPVPIRVLAHQLAGSHLALIESWIWGDVAVPADTIAAALLASAAAARAMARADG